MTVRVLVVDDQRLVREGVASLLALEEGITVVGTAADGREAVAEAVARQPDVVLMDVQMPTTDGLEATAAVRRRAPGCRVVMLTTFDDEEYVVRALRAGACGYLLKDLPAAELARAVRMAHAGVDQFDPAATARLLAALERGTPHRGPASASASSFGSGPGAGTGSRAVDDGSARPGTAGGFGRTGTGESGRAEAGSGGSGGSGAGSGGFGRAAAGSGGGAGRSAVPGLTAREVDVLRLIARGATNREIAAALVVSEGTVKNHVSNILSRLGLRDRTQAALHARDHGLA